MKEPRERKRYKFILERSSKDEFEKLAEKEREYVDFFMKEASILEHAGEEIPEELKGEKKRKEINEDLKEKALDHGLDKYISIKHPTAGNIRFERYRVEIEEFKKFEKWEYEDYKPSFDDFTVPELLEIAEYRRVDAKTSDRKDEVIKKLKKKKVRKKNLLKIAKKLKI